MAYNKSSPGIHEQNAAKHTLAYAIWNGLMDRAEATDDTDALEAMHREAERMDVERERDGVTIDEVQFSYELALRRSRPRQPLASAVEPNLVQLARVRLAGTVQANRTRRPT
jgi:hypothetical protein